MIRTTKNNNWYGFVWRRNDGVAHCSLKGDHGAQCSGYARGFLTGYYQDTTDYEAIAWGYEGEGPLHCAASIIYGTMVGRYDNKNPPHCSYDKSFRPSCMLSKKQIELTHKFHTEVVANLPDNWEMAGDEIKRWIKDGKLPKCIKPTKPKPKKTKPKDK